MRLRRVFDDSATGFARWCVDLVLETEGGPANSVIDILAHLVRPATLALKLTSPECKGSLAVATGFSDQLPCGVQLNSNAAF